MTRLILALLVFTPLLATGATQVQDFDQLLLEAQLRFVKPAGYQDLSPAANPVMNYERALRSPDNALEIRIAIRPLERMQIDYEDPHGAIPDPNHIFPLVFESLLSRLSGGSYAPSREYAPDQAKEHFRADWAAAAVFDTNPELDTPYAQGLALALHRSKVSDAYVIFLFNDYPTIKPLLAQAMTSLVYTDTGNK